MVKLFMFVNFAVLFAACSVTPIDVAQQRYDNLGETRELELVHKTDYTAIVLAKKKGGKCREVETVALNKLNKNREWRIVRLHNERDCENEKNNEFIKRFKEWKRDR